MVLGHIIHNIKQFVGEIKYAYNEYGLIHMIKNSHKAPIMVSSFIFSTITSVYLSYAEGLSPIEAKKRTRGDNDILDSIERKDPDRSKLLHESIIEYCENPQQVISIGCHSGERLSYLYENGIEGINGIELNEKAIEIMAKNHTELYEKSNIYIGRAQKVLSEIPNNSFDVVYSVSVLQLIQTDCDELFDHMARVSNDLIITIEVEEKDKPIRQGEFRNYEEVFTSRGFEQVHNKKFWVINDGDSKSIVFNKCKGELIDKAQVLRVFKKK